MTRLSSFGRKRFAASVAIFMLAVVNTALSARINQFQDFFYVADQFPLALAIVTMVSYFAILSMDISKKNNVFVRAPFILVLEFVLSGLWLGFNAFSTSRWRHIPLQCDEIPKHFDDERRWCRDLQALKSLVWLELVIILLSFIVTLAHVMGHRAAGNGHIFKAPLTRYDPSDETTFSPANGKGGWARQSEFLQYPSPGRETVAPFSSTAGRAPADMVAAYQANGPSGSQGGHSPTQQQQYEQQPAAEAYYQEQTYTGPYARPQQPASWVAFPPNQGEPSRDSTADGPGMAGRGAGPAPGNWGGFERM